MAIKTMEKTQKKPVEKPAVVMDAKFVEYIPSGKYSTVVCAITMKKKDAEKLTCLQPIVIIVEQ